MSIHITSAQLQAMEQRYRATLINSVGGYKSLCVIGTRNRDGQTNLAVFSSLFHLGANPPLLGIIVRPDSVDRHTLDNILSTRQFTINHVHEHWYQAAHQTAARYPGNQSEFKATGLTEQYVTGFYAPFVQESKVHIGAQFRERVDIRHNGTVMIIAEIVHIALPEEALMPDGFVDLAVTGTLTVSGLDSYHTATRLSRMAYAKPGVPPATIPVTGAGGK